MQYKKVPINDHPNYQIDTNGVVYGKSGCPLKPAINGKGYLLVILCENGKTCGKLVHRLVAEHFIPNPDNKPTVNHINGDKQKNCIENLEWATYHEQINHCNNVLYAKDYNFNEDWEKFDDIVIVSTLTSLYIFPSPRTAAAWFWEYANLDSYNYAYRGMWQSLNRPRLNKHGYAKRQWRGCTFWRLEEFNYYLSTGDIMVPDSKEITIPTNIIQYQCEELNINQDYTIDTNGVIINKNTGKIIQAYTDSLGFYQISLRKEKCATAYNIAHLVANQFIPNPNNYPVVWYKDGDSSNYSANNLFWVSYKELNRILKEQKVA